MSRPSRLAPVNGRVATERTRKLRRARPRDAVELLAICAATLRVEWCLRRQTLPVTARSLGMALFADGAPVDTEPTLPAPFALPAWAWRRARIVDVVMRRWPFGDTCLRRTLVTGNRLARLDPELVIGVRVATTRRAIDAHAWLRIDGVDLDPLATEYLAFGAA